MGAMLLSSYWPECLGKGPMRAWPAPCGAMVGGWEGGGFRAERGCSYSDHDSILIDWENVDVYISGGRGSINQSLLKGQLKISSRLSKA